MQGQLSLKALAAEVEAQTIDTVVAAFPDMQGRLVGKRFHAGYFCDSAHDETHGCNYLLACDIDMEPVPGYQAASWQKGYGDFVLMQPPVVPRTWLLWAAPALFLAGGILVVLVVVRRRARVAAADPAALDEEPDRP